MQITDF